MTSIHGLQASDSGLRAFDATAGFDQIDLAVSAAIGADAAVTISVSASLAAHWLLPRLSEFKRLHPDIALRVITTDSDRGVGRNDADLWIPLGIVESDDLEPTEFCVEEIVPVAAPSIAGRLPFGEPAALLEAPLLHNGRLVALAAPLRTEKSFPILQRRDRMLSPAAAALRDWLKSATPVST